MKLILKILILFSFSFCNISKPNPRLFYFFSFGRQPSLKYQNENYILIISERISIIPIESSNISSCSSNVSLPSGLNLNSDCSISGISKEFYPRTSIQITGINSFGTDSKTISIYIDNSPSLSYKKSKYTFYLNIPIPTLSPIKIGSLTNFKIEPELPLGLSLNPLSGEISGTSNSTSIDKSYLISAENLIRNVSYSIQIRIGNQTASKVFGQGGSFTSSVQNLGGISTNSLSSPEGICFDKNDGTYIADRENNRVLFYPNSSTTATRVYGQSGNFTSNTANNGGLSANSFIGPMDCELDSVDNLYVADFYNNRVLFFPKDSTTATRVYGQFGNFNTALANNGGVSANSLDGPRGVSIDQNDNLYLVDSNNNRILFYPKNSTTATRVYGQLGSFSTNIANNGGISSNSINFALGVFHDKQNSIYIAEYSNHRILKFDGTSQTATKVFGQNGNDTSASINNGGLSASSLYSPVKAVSDEVGGLFISDSLNNRVLFIPNNSTTSTVVFGQPNFTSSSPVLSANGMNYNFKIALDSRGSLCVVEFNHHRVICF